MIRELMEVISRDLTGKRTRILIYLYVKPLNSCRLIHSFHNWELINTKQETDTRDYGAGAVCSCTDSASRLSNHHETNTEHVSAALEPNPPNKKEDLISTVVNSLLF